MKNWNGFVWLVMIWVSIMTSGGLIIIPRIFWTEGYKPTAIDTLYYCNYNMSPDQQIGSYNDCLL